MVAMRRVVIGLGLSLLLACGGDPWKRKDAPKVPPDEQYRTGTEVGSDYWIWHCYEGHRVMIAQSSSAFFGASGQRLERGPCDVPFPEEAEAKRRGRSGMYGSMRWPGSPPEPPDKYEEENRLLRDAMLDAGAAPVGDAGPTGAPSPSRGGPNDAGASNPNRGGPSDAGRANDARSDSAK